MFSRMISDLGSDDAECVAFIDNDTFVEHIETSNTKSIKDIVEPLATLSALSSCQTSLVDFFKTQI